MSSRRAARRRRCFTITPRPHPAVHAGRCTRAEARRTSYASDRDPACGNGAPGRVGCLRRRCVNRHLLGLLVAWALLGVAPPAAITPSGRLCRSAHPADRPVLFVAQFALSHACWLLTYPLACWLGPAARLVPTVLAPAALMVAGAIVAAWLWPAADPSRSRFSSCSSINGCVGRSPTAVSTTVQIPSTNPTAASKPPIIAPTKPIENVVQLLAVA
jgi:hypothetical protein